jgi:hypothetical protein
MHGIVPNKKHEGPYIKVLVVLTLTLVLAGLIYVHSAYATPVAPVLLANHTLKQCIDHVVIADECYFCTPAEGWEILQAGQCPSGYIIIVRQTLMDLPLNCVEYPKNEWAACSWGKYPTITPEYLTVTVIPSLTITAQQSVIYLLTPSTAPTASANNKSSSEHLILSILCMGCIIALTIISIVLVLIRRKKILPDSMRKI